MRGFLRGVVVNTFRGFLGPGSQITSYSLLKDYVVSNDWDGFGATNVATHVVCSLASAAVSVLAVNPVDVIRTRLYNQPFGSDGRGLRYRGGLDASIQLFRAEGLGAFYKGGIAHLGRLGPHMLLVFTILEQLKQIL